MSYSPAVESAWRALSSALPIESAMGELLPTDPTGSEGQAAAIVASQHLTPTLQAAFYLYADDLHRSHQISQGLDTEEGAFWHGIMHRREGDFSNAKYWFRKAGSLPERLGLDPTSLTDQVSRAPRSENPADLVQLQRAEWMTLFDHCAKEGV
jgi:hypothetical protein